jgi:anti-sigma factor RsiW
MTCQEAIDLLADFLDQSLSADLATTLESHLEGCGPCRAYLATYARTRKLGGDVQRVAMPDEMKERLRRFLLDRLQGRV